MSNLEELDVKYNVKRHIIIVVIVAIVLLLIWVFWPYIIDLIQGDTDEGEPSERLHNGFRLLIIFFKNLL